MSDHVALIIVNTQNEILFCQRSRFKKKLPLVWAFPTGTIEKRETMFDTAAREAQEELGDTLHFIVCTILSGNPSIREPQEIEQLEWLTFDEFFAAHDESQIGHGLLYLKSQPQLIEQI